MKKILTCLAVLLQASAFVVAATAQEPAPAAVDPAAPQAAAAQPADAATAAAIQPSVDLNAPFTQSLLFSPAEIVALRRAAQGGSVGTAVLNADSTTVIPEKRVISLAGVVYRAPGDWIVWLNGKKMTPKDILPEVVEIKVSQDRVHLKWFDIGLNNVISITLRPHQTYDIVTGVLLPG